MAQFRAFAPNVEVNGETVLSIINAFPDYLKDFAYEILEDHGIKDPKPGEWYKQQAWLDSFNTISQKFGENTLFEIGKVIPENAQFPPDINTLEKGLSAIDVAYHMNHRNGDIGYYKLISFDGTSNKAVMECKNPYPCDFDRGIITTMARKFRPENSKIPEVNSAPNKASRKNGDDSSTYIIVW